MQCAHQLMSLRSESKNFTSPTLSPVTKYLQHTYKGRLRWCRHTHITLHRVAGTVCVQHYRDYHLRVHCGHGSDGGGVQLHQFQWLTDVWLQQSCADECMQEAKEMQLDSTHASLPHMRWCTMRTPGSVHCYLARTMLSPLHLSFPSPVHSLLAALPPTPLLIPLRWCSRQWLCRGGRNILRGDPASC